MRSVVAHRASALTLGQSRRGKLAHRVWSHTLAQGRHGFSAQGLGLRACCTAGFPIQSSSLLFARIAHPRDADCAKLAKANGLVYPEHPFTPNPASLLSRSTTTRLPPRHARRRSEIAPAASARATPKVETAVPVLVLLPLLPLLLLLPLLPLVLLLLLLRQHLYLVLATVIFVIHLAHD